MADDTTGGGSPPEAGPVDTDNAERLKETIKDILDLETKSLDRIEELLSAQDDYQKRLEKVSSSKQKNILLAESEVEKARLLVDKQKQIIAGSTELEKADLDRLKVLEKQYKEADKSLKKILGTSKAIKEGTAAATEFGTTFASSLSQYEKHPFFNAGNLIKVGKALMGGRKAAGAFIGALGVGIVMNFVDAIIGLIFEMDKAENSMRRATGASEAFTKRMRGVYGEVRSNTVGMKEFYDQVTNLRSGFTDFTMLAASTQDELAKVMSTMTKIGHSGDDLTKGLQTATVAFQMTGTEAMNTMMELDAFARDMQEPPGKITAAYARMGSQLSKLGDNGTKAFKDLARVSKITGIEMEKILQVTNKFDTFEGAAERAGLLNAALGGNFMNAMDMMMETDPVGRFQMIKDAIEGTGLSFDDMGYYQKQFYAEAAGLEDVSQLAALMRGDFDALSGDMGKTEADYARMAEEAKTMANFQDRFNAIMMKLIPILEPVLDYIDQLLTYYEENEVALTDAEGPLFVFINALQTLGGVMMFVIEHIEVFVAIWIAGLITKIPILAGLLNGLGARIAMVGATSGGAAGPTAGFAASIALLRPMQIIAVGVSFMFVAAGVAAIALAFSTLNIPQLLGFLGFMIALIWVAPAVGAAFSTMIVTIAGASTAAAPVTPIILAIGAAILMMGGAIALAGLGMKLMGEGIAIIFNAIEMEKVLAFTLFLGGVGLFLKFAPLAITGMLLLAGGLLGVSWALSTMPNEQMKNLGIWTDAMARVKVSQYNEFATALERIAEAMKSIPYMKALAFQATVETAAVVTEAIRQLGGPGGSKPATKTASGAGQSREIARMPITVVIGGDKFDAQVIRVLETSEGQAAIDAVNGQG